MNAVIPKIRPMRESDLSGVVALQCLVYEPFFHESMTAFAAKLSAAPDYCLVAEVADDIVGYVVSLPMLGYALPVLDARTIASAASPDSLYLHDMAILPEYRQGGLGRRFLHILLENAKKKLLKKIVLIAVRNSSPFWMKHHFRLPEPLPSGVAAKLQTYGPDARYLERPLDL